MAGGLVRSILWVIGVPALVCLVCAKLSAQPQVPPEAADLPQAGQGDLAGTLINRSNAIKFKDIIVPELYPDVRGGLIEMDAVRELQYPWQMDSGWQSDKALSPKLTDGQGALTAGAKLDRGFLFGGLERLRREGNPRVAARHALWNVHSVFWSQKLMDAAFSLRILDEGKVVREMQGSMRRVYPSSLIPNDRTGQLFHEIVRIDRPETLKDYAWLSFRFLSTEEDAVYVYSPAIRKTRELTGSNRSDAFAGAVMAVDDLLVWSGKPDLVDPEVTGRLVALTPLTGVALRKVVPAGDFCVRMDNPAANGDPAALSRWNVGSGRFSGAAPWLPTEIVFAPRELWRVQLISNDPFSLYGRQVLYVDAESMLPVYKFVYDQAGILWKTVLGAIGLAEGQDHKRYPYYALELINDAKSKQSVLMDFMSLRYCSQFPQGMELNDFQPSKLSR